MDTLFFPPLPVPMIKNECEEIIIVEECSDDSGGKSNTDLWDEEIRKKISKLIVYQNEKIFNAVVEEYLRLLKRHATVIQDKHCLIDKISNHIQMFATFYQEGYENSFQQKYLDIMEEVMTVFSNLQMDIVRQIKKRGCNKTGYVTIIKGIAQKMCHLLSSSLLYNLKHILHVLLKATKHDMEPPSWKDIMNTVYSHFLIQYPLHDYSSESFCRNFLLFERWKEITRPENHKDMEKTLYYRCRQTPKSVKADKVISSILMPSSMDSVPDIVTHLIKGKSDAIKSYFDYIEKQKKKCTADEPVCLNDLSFCDLDDELDYMSRGSDECSKLFYDIVKDYENAKLQGASSTDINNHEINEDLSEEGDCIVIDDDDLSEYGQRESDLVCVISDSDSDCEMIYSLNTTKKKNSTKTKSNINAPSIPQLWSKTFPESVEKASSALETNFCNAQSEEHDDVQVLDSECVSSVESSGKKSAAEDTSISLNRESQIERGGGDIREVLRNLVIVTDSEPSKSNDEVINSSTSLEETDLSRVSIPEKIIQSESNSPSSNVTDSSTDRDKNNVQDNNYHHCSCCAKNKVTFSSPLLISSNQDSGDNREIERSKIAEISTEIRIEGLESVPNGHTYSYGLITPPSDQPAEGNSSPTCDNVYVEIPARDSPRSVINSESEELVLEDDALLNDPSIVENSSENENVKTKNSGETPLTKDDSSKCALEDVNKINPTESIVDSVSKETSELVSETVELKTKEVEKNIQGEISSEVKENNSISVLNEGNTTHETNVNTNNEVENITPILSQELIVFKGGPLPNGENTADGVEISTIDNDLQPVVEEIANDGETSFFAIGSTDSELTNFTQYVIDGQHYVVKTDKKNPNFVTNGVYLDENGQEYFVENENNIQSVIIEDVYYTCENGLLTIEEVNCLNSSTTSTENNPENIENNTEVSENVNNFTNLDHTNKSNGTNINHEVTNEYHNTNFNDVVTSTTPTETVSDDAYNEKCTEDNVITQTTVEEARQADNLSATFDSKNSKSTSKIMYTSTESIKLTDFDKFEKTVNGKLIDLNEDGYLWENAFSGPVTKLNSNSSANFSGDSEEMYGFQCSNEKNESLKKNKSEDICRSHSASPIENSPEYETIETGDFKKYILEKENTTQKKASKDYKQNSVLIHLDKSKIPESVLQKAREQKINQKATKEEVLNTKKSVLKRKSVTECSNPSKKKATVNLTDPYMFEPESELTKNEKEKSESLTTKSHKIPRRSSESEKQKAIEVVFGKSRYLKNNEHLAVESKRKPHEEPEGNEDDAGFIKLKNLSSYRKQQIAYSCVIRYYSKRRKVYDPQLFEMLPEVSLPFFSENELLKRWKSQRMKTDCNRWRMFKQVLKTHQKEREMTNTCIRERHNYDRTAKSQEVLMYNDASTHESSNLTSSSAYSVAKNYNSGKRQQHAHQMDKSRGNGVIHKNNTPPRKKRGNTRKSVSNKKTKNTGSIAANYQCRNTDSNDVTSYTAGETTSKEKGDNPTLRCVGPNFESTFDTSDKLKTGTFNAPKRKRGRKPSTIVTFPANNNQYEVSKRAKTEEKTLWNDTNMSDTNRGSCSTSEVEVRDEKKSSSSALQKNTDKTELEKLNSKEMEQKDKNTQHVEASISKTVPKGIISRESNIKSNSKVRVTFGAVIVNYYNVDNNESKNNSDEKGKIPLNGDSLKTATSMKGLSLDGKSRKMTNKSVIRKIFQNKIKNKTRKRRRMSNKKATFDKFITTNSLTNGINKVQQDEEDLEHKLKAPLSLLKNDSTTSEFETLTESSVNQGQTHKPFKTLAERKELPPLPVENATNSAKLSSPIVNDLPKTNSSTNHESKSIVPVVTKNNCVLPDSVLQRTETPESGNAEIKSANQLHSPHSLFEGKKLSPLPVLYNLSTTSSKCYQSE